MRVPLAAAEIANDAPKIEFSDLFTLVNPLIEDRNHTEIRVPEGANSGVEVMPRVRSCKVSSCEKNPGIVRVWVRFLEDCEHC